VRVIPDGKIKISNENDRFFKPIGELYIGSEIPVSFLYGENKITVNNNNYEPYSNIIVLNEEGNFIDKTSNKEIGNQLVINLMKRINFETVYQDKPVNASIKIASLDGKFVEKVISNSYVLLSNGKYNVNIYPEGKCFGNVSFSFSLDTIKNNNRFKILLKKKDKITLLLVRPFTSAFWGKKIDVGLYLDSFLYRYDYFDTNKDSIYFDNLNPDSIYRLTLKESGNIIKSEIIKLECDKDTFEYLIR
jgi:hypothetical protein